MGAYFVNPYEEPMMIIHTFPGGMEKHPDLNGQEHIWLSVLRGNADDPRGRLL